MSVEFSGQITRSGCGVVPARTSAASSWVRWACMSSTARRSALNSRPGRGTSPWMTAMVSVGASVPCCTVAGPTNPSTNGASSMAMAPSTAADRQLARAIASSWIS